MKITCLILVVLAAVRVNSDQLDVDDSEQILEEEKLFQILEEEEKLVQILEEEEKQETITVEPQDVIGKASKEKYMYARTNSNDTNSYGGIYYNDNGLDWLFGRTPSPFMSSRLDFVDEDPANGEEGEEMKPKSVLVEKMAREDRGKASIIDVVRKGPYGVRPSFDPAAKDFSHAYRKDMITGVKLYWFLHERNKIFRQVGFKTSSEDYPPVPQGVDVGTNTELILQKDEYITEIELIKSINFIHYIKFITNRGNSIEAGIDNGVDKEKISSYKGPLLYTKGFQGYWLYEIEFTFFKHGVKSEGLKNFIDEMVKDIYNTLKSDVTKLGDEIYPKYQWMFPGIVARYCFDYTIRQVEKAQKSCDAEFLINGMNTLRIGVDSYRNHQPRAMKFSDYDTNRQLDLAKDAKNIKSSIYELKLSISQSARITEDLASQLGNYFSSTAAFDKGIAEMDRNFIKGRIADLNNEYESAKDRVFRRLKRILGVAMASQNADFLAKGVELAIEIKSSLNPFTTDVGDIVDKATAMAETGRNSRDIAILIANLKKYSNHLQEMKDKIDSNQQQEASTEMQRIFTTYSNMTEDQKKEAAASFIQNYGDYSPAVGAEDLAYSNAWLEAVASKSCELAESVETIIGIAVQTITAARQDCQYIFAEIAELTIVYEELYSFQFELVDTFAAIVRADVAQTAAKKISAVSTTIDLTETSIALMMMEITYQAAAHARCIVLEYTMGGKRINDCEALIFTDNAVNNILSYTGGSVSTSSESRDVFIPTSDQGDNTPFINLKDFLKGGVFSLSLPRGEVAKNWLIKNKWLIQSEVDARPEDSYYINAFEAYIPNLQCENNETTDITIEARTSKYTRLFTEEATATYLRAKTFYSFKYNEHDLAFCDEKEYFKIRAQDAKMTEKGSVPLCMVSRGQSGFSTPNANFMELPSMLSTWQLKLTKTSSECKLVVKDSSWTPMMTVRLDLFVVKQTGIDECFPTGTRCPRGKRCVDQLLDYQCVKNSG